MKTIQIGVTGGVVRIRVILHLPFLRTGFGPVSMARLMDMLMQQLGYPKYCAQVQSVTSLHMCVVIYSS